MLDADSVFTVIAKFDSRCVCLFTAPLLTTFSVSVDAA